MILSFYAKENAFKKIYTVAQNGQDSNIKQDSSMEASQKHDKGCSSQNSYDNYQCAERSFS